jgi:RNA polymerase sigma-70 factor (ECF subfamily)
VNAALERDPTPNMISSDPSSHDMDAGEDIALMLRVKAGDMDAFEALVERHQHSVVGTVAKMLGNDSDAEDIAQQVFVRVWKSASRYEPTAKFTTWLMTITRNLVFNESRRRGRSRLVPLESDDPDVPQTQHVDTSVGSPQEQMLGGELRSAVDSAIASLPEPQRLAIVLRRFEEMPYEEIAKVLRTSVPAVKSILFRARNELRDRLKKYLD